MRLYLLYMDKQNHGKKRLSQQLEVLLVLAETECQIIYLSVKDEVKAGLQGAINENKVTLKEVEPL